jgi:hypothetical protein
VSEGALWPDPDRSPGGTTTLRRLHDLVPAAEEADILEDVADAEAAAHCQRLMDEVRWPDDDPPDTPDPTEDLRPEVPSTEQIIAMLHRTLGATVIEEFRAAGEADSV